MVVIKGKEKKLKKKISTVHGMTERAKKKLKRPQDNQPIPVVSV